MDLSLLRVRRRLQVFVSFILAPSLMRPRLGTGHPMSSQLKWRCEKCEWVEHIRFSQNVSHAGRSLRRDSKEQFLSIIRKCPEAVKTKQKHISEVQDQAGTLPTNVAPDSGLLRDFPLAFMLEVSLVQFTNKAKVREPPVPSSSLLLLPAAKNGCVFCSGTPRKCRGSFQFPLKPPKQGYQYQKKQQHMDQRGDKRSSRAQLARLERRACARSGLAASGCRAAGSAYGPTGT